MKIDINPEVLRAEDRLEQRLKEAHPPYAEAVKTMENERDLALEILEEIGRKPAPPRYSLALIDQAAEDFPGFGERCRKVLAGAPSRQTFLMSDAQAFMQLDYLAQGEDAMHSRFGCEPAAGFYVDTHCYEGVDTIFEFARKFNLSLPTACAVLAASISRIMRISLKGEVAGACEHGAPPVPEESLPQQEQKEGK